VGVVVEAIHELFEVFMDHGVAHDLVIPILQLIPGGQLALQQQPGYFQEGAMFGELLDRVPTISQNAFVAIQVGDGARAGSRVHEGRIVSHEAKVIGSGHDLPQVHGSNGTAVNRDRLCCLCPIVGNCQRFVVFSRKPLGVENHRGAWVSLPGSSWSTGQATQNAPRHLALLHILVYM
jgi:hypothetical protein